MQAIPLGVLFGSAATLFGVLIANLFSFLTHRQRLAHEAQLKKEERDWTSRRDIYLKAVEELAKNFKYLMTFGDFSMSVKDHSALIERFGESAAKVHLVGSWETIKKVNLANDFFLRAMIELNEIRIPLLNDLEGLKDLEAKIQSEVGRWDSIVKETGKGLLSEQQHHTVTQALREIESAINDLKLRRDALEKQICSGRCALMVRGMERGFEYTEMLVEANIAIRKELNLKLDGEAYRRLMRNSRAESSSCMKGFLQRLLGTEVAQP